MSYAEASYIIDEVTANGAGIIPNAMRKLSVAAGDTKITIKFTEPEDTVVDGQTLCNVAGVKIVLNDNHYAKDENDGRLITNNTEIGKYTTNGIEVTGLENGKTYYVSAFPYTDRGAVNRSAALQTENETYAVNNRCKVTPQQYVLYGFKRKKADSNPKTRLTATDMAVGMTKAAPDFSTGKTKLNSWAGAWFVAGNKPAMIKSNGQIDYYLNPDDLTQKATGGASDIANSAYDGNAMAIFPTCWVKRWQDSNYEYFQVCNIQLDSSFKAYAHQRQDGSVMEWFARAIYDGAVVSGKLRSLSGLAPNNSVAGNTQLSYAAAVGAQWDTDTWSRVALIWDLLRLMSLNDDVQEAWGYGYYSGMSQASHLKASGTGNTKGAWYGKGRNVQEVVKIFNIENFWGNIWKITQGLLYNTNGRYAVKMTRPYNNTGSGYAATSFGITGTSGGYQSAHNTSEYGTLPTTASGSATTYIPDGVWFNQTQQNFARFGSEGVDGALAGCALYLGHALSYAYWDFGAALTCEQPL